MMPGILLLLFTGLLLGGCTEEQQNRLTRLGVTWLEGNYRVTYADGEHVKSWEVRDSKVTSEPEKGYYFFWVQGGRKSLLRANPDCAKLCRANSVARNRNKAIPVRPVTGIMNATPDSVRRPGSRFLLRHEAAAVVVEL